jgi:hypothetical protein
MKPPDVLGVGQRIIVVEYDDPKVNPKLKNFADLIDWAFENDDKYLLKRATEAIQEFK